MTKVGSIRVLNTGAKLRISSRSAPRVSDNARSRMREIDDAKAGIVRATRAAGERRG